MKDRRETLLSLFDTSGKGLEIGPSFNPLLRKSDGYNVDILDHLDSDGLRKKYEGSGVDVSRLEEVDFVSDGGSLVELIGRRSCYEYCIALHVIEHTTDLLGFLLDCDALLSDKGVLVLAVPDKRFSFDVLRPISTIGHVIQAHLEPRKRHSPGQILDELAYNVLRGGLPAWGRDNMSPIEFFRKFQDVKPTFEALTGSNEFVDIHGWQFTPSSFRLLVNDLQGMGFMELREKSFVDGGGAEFYMTLSKDGSGCSVDRMSLLRNIGNELNAIKF